VNAANERDRIRRRTRALRRAIDPVPRRIAERAINGRLRRLAAYQRARRIGIYYAIDGEVCLTALIADAQHRGKQVYAPLVDDDELRFVEAESGCTFVLNRYGIPEPQGGAVIDPRMLDLVLTPLVAFSPLGLRLGMGAGFYDRGFKFLKLRQRWLRPKLIGVGFDAQRVETLAAEPWDIRLWGAVTDRGIETFRY
jgi:5-formyltetrahydrofolate cyclo-ligase